MNRLLRPALSALALAAAVGTGPGLSAKLEPEAQVQTFTFRKFDDRGLRLWDLSGKEAVFLNDSVIEVIQMQLSIASTGDDPDTLLRSPSARIYVEDNSATGEGFIFVEGPGFSATGRGWEWKGREKMVDVRSDAKVTFDEAISRVLQ
ncbi:MAG: hypothetical protein ACLFTU_02090 [Puniceicoccaceae bacterium]